MTSENRDAIPFGAKPNDANPDETKIYLVGGGIASLAAAAFLIRDADILGHNITILEELDRPGGSLDGAGSAQDGYVRRGGRMFESKFLCTYDLFSSIPTLDESKTVTREIFDWSETIKTSSKCRLVRGGQRQTAPALGLSERHILDIVRLSLEPEAMLGKSSIADQFEPSFFETNFWFMWCTTFAFQPWHSAVEFKRYVVRFTHMVPGFNRLRGIMRNVYNEYDSMIRPLQKWLDDRGVRFELNTRVTDLIFGDKADEITVERIVTEHSGGGSSSEITVRPNDFVIVTLGSMTEASSLGSMDTAPVLRGKSDGGAWVLWERIAAGRPQLGRPSIFADHVDEFKMGIIHHDVARCDVLSSHPGFHGQRSGRGRPHGLRRLELARLDRAAASAAFHWAAQGRQRLLGLWAVRRQARELREEANVGMHWPRNHDRDSVPSPDRGGGGADHGDLDLYPLHDAVHHKSVPAAGKGRSTAGSAGRLD